MFQFENTCSMASSMGGSSTVRSMMGRLASNFPVTSAVFAFGTRRVTLLPSAVTTSP